MAMKIEIHILQNFAPSNLNRDDTGAPKDCELGGFRRARISSQCQKRAVRQAFRLDELLPEQNLAARTKRLVYEVASELGAAFGRDQAQARSVALGAIEGVGLGRSKKGTGEEYWKTEYLLYVPKRLVKKLAALIHENWEQLAPLAAAANQTTDAEPMSDEAPSQEDAPAEGRGKGAKAAKKPQKKDLKKEAKAAYPPEMRKKVEDLLSGTQATADLALFGRMIADKPEWNLDAACQVAHAISTNKVLMDFDFFTAVDDFKPGETTGSDMMGTIQFNSSCFYRYAVLDVAGLDRNLDLKTDSEQLLAKTVEAFMRSFVTAIPTGKQNSMAAHNPPSYVLAVMHEGAPISLANAFLKPARPRGEEIDLVDDSINKLEAYLSRMHEHLEGAVAVSWMDRDESESSSQRSATTSLRPQRMKSLKSLYEEVKSRALASLGASA